MTYSFFLVFGLNQLSTSFTANTGTLYQHLAFVLWKCCGEFIRLLKTNLPYLQKGKLGIVFRYSQSILQALVSEAYYF